MGTIKFKSVNEYIAAQPETVRGILERVRSTVRKAVPAAEETISYNIPSFKIHGRSMLYFAAWKQHFSLYPASEHIVAAFKKDLAHYQVSKGTIRVPLSEAVPVKLIERIVKLREMELAEGAKSKAASPKKAQSRTKRPPV